jgi:DsbC/DsbD-like thiol-disulfide interchange protein
MYFLRNVAIGCSVLLGFCLTTYGQRPSEVVKWSAGATKSTAHATTVTLSATIQDGWHVYALSQPPGGPTPLKISVPAGAPFEIGAPIKEVNVTRHDDPNFKMETLYYLNAVTLHVAMKNTGAASATTIPVDVRFQACNDRLCLPPYTAHLTAPLARQ